MNPTTSRERMENGNRWHNRQSPCACSPLMLNSNVCLW